MSQEKGSGQYYHQHHHDEEQPPPQPQAQAQYGTFQGVANYPQPQPAMGFPQPGHSAQATAHYYAHGYQASVPGYAIVEGRPIRERLLPCCGIGYAWFLFIIGFFLAGIPWYVGAFVLLCARYDHREKPGYVACAIAAVLAAIAVVFGLTSDDWDWDWDWD